MREIQLTPRLAAVAEKVPTGCRLVDVGTDHARLPIWLLQKGQIACAIASDLRKGPLQQAARNLATHQLTEGVTLVQCPGLTGIDLDRVDVVTICGMGGETVLHILEETPAAREKRLILQPQSNLALLRRFLQGNGYAIVQESLCRDRGYFYVIWQVEAGEMPPLTSGEAYCGRPETWEPSADWGDYLTQVIGKMEYELQFLEKSEQEKDFPRRDDFRAAVAELRVRKERLPW